MTWLKLDDAMGDHPKIVPLSNGAFRVHILGLLYASRLTTDGHVPALVAHRFMRGSARYCAELVEAGVWHESESGYEIHDYLDHNPSREHVTEVKAKRADSGKRGGLISRKQNASTKDSPIPSHPIDPPNPPQVGDTDFEEPPPNSRAAGTNPRALAEVVDKAEKTRRQRAAQILRAREHYASWCEEMSEAEAAHTLREAFPDIAEIILQEAA